MHLFFKCMALFLYCASVSMQGMETQDQQNKVLAAQETIFQQYKPRFIFQCTDGTVALDDGQHERLKQRISFFASQADSPEMTNSAVCLLNGGEYAFTTKDVETLLNIYDVYKPNFLMHEKEHYSVEKYSEHQAQLNNCFKLADHWACQPYIGFIKKGDFYPGYTFHWAEKGMRYLRTIALDTKERQDTNENKKVDKQMISYNHLLGLHAFHGISLGYKGRPRYDIRINNCHLNLSLHELTQLMRTTSSLFIQGCTGTIFESAFDEEAPYSERLLRLNGDAGCCINYRGVTSQCAPTITLKMLTVSKTTLQKLAREWQRWQRDNDWDCPYVTIEQSIIPTLDWAAMQALLKQNDGSCLSVDIRTCTVNEIMLGKEEKISLTPTIDASFFSSDNRAICVSVPTVNDILPLNDRLLYGQYLSAITCQGAELRDIVELFKKQKDRFQMYVWIKIYGPLLHNGQELITPVDVQKPLELRLTAELGKQRNIHIKSGDIKMHSGDLINLYQSLLK